VSFSPNSCFFNPDLSAGDLLRLRNVRSSVY